MAAAFTPLEEQLLAHFKAKGVTPRTADEERQLFQEKAAATQFQFAPEVSTSDEPGPIGEDEVGPSSQTPEADGNEVVEADDAEAAALDEDDPDRLREFEGKCVEITDFEPTAESLVDPNGMCGWAEWNLAKKMYLVHTYEGLHLDIPEECILDDIGVEPEDGGFDTPWPDRGIARQSCAESIIKALSEKGWCVIQTKDLAEKSGQIMDFGRRRNLSYSRLKAEFEEDYLGRTPMRVAWLDLEVERERGSASGAFAKNCCSIGESLAMAAGRADTDILGLANAQPCVGRTLSRRPLASSDNPDPVPLTEDDIKDGQVEIYLDFLQRQKLCMMHFISTGEGGAITLHERDDPDKELVRLPYAEGTLLVYRPDTLCMSYTQSDGDDIIFQNWLMEKPQRLALYELEGDHKDMELIFGAPPQAPEVQVNVMGGFCRFPGHARNIETDWLCFATCADLHVRVPGSRFDIADYFEPEGLQFASDGKTIIQHSAFLDDEELRCFDNRFFGIAEDVAICMAPCQRVLLEVVYEGMMHMGYTRETLRGEPLFIAVGEGVSNLDWEWTSNRFIEFKGYDAHPEAWLQAHAAWGTNSANRLAHTLGTKGPAMMVDTACSSVLACTNIIHPRLKRKDEGDVETGIASGSQHMMSPYPFIGGSMAGLHGNLGRCATFDAAANGFVRGEGAGGICLSSKNKLEQVQNRLACYISSFTNQDGRSASLTAPNGASQADCIRASLRDGNLSPSDTSVTEVHGTATAIGDPIECGSIAKIFKKHETTICVTAAKSHVGHTEPVSGAYGLLQVLTSLIHSNAKPNVHLAQLSKNIHAFSMVDGGFPAIFPTENTDFVNDYAINGVTSFGYGGTNCRAEMWAPGRRVRNPVETMHRGNRGVLLDKFDTSSRFRSLELERMDAVTVTCPRCSGQMCWLCGAALSDETGGKHVCATVRAKSASYDYCSLCYGGSYTFGGINASPLELGQKLYITGSWTAWTACEDMEVAYGGAYPQFTKTVYLGETRVDRFYFLMEGDHGKAFYPIVDKASATARIQGPSENANSTGWQLDGFRDGVPAGSAYRITFEWCSDKPRVFWKPINVGAYMSAMLAIAGYQHSYYIARRATGWQPELMECRDGDPGVWEFKGAIGPSGEEEFHFLRDEDAKQVIYPFTPTPYSTYDPVMGPDDCHSDRGWMVMDHVGTTYDVMLHIEDGHFTITAETENFGARTWQSSHRLRKDIYAVTASWNGFYQEEMTPDENAPDILRYWFDMGASGRGEFQLVLNGSDETRLHPPTAQGALGAGELVCGPDPNPRNFCWEVFGEPGHPMEITLDLSAEDRRFMLACRPWVEKGEDEEAADALSDDSEEPAPPKAPAKASAPPPPVMEENFADE